MYSSDSARVFKVPGHSVVYSRDQASVFKVPAWSQCSVFKGLGQCIQGTRSQCCVFKRPGQYIQGTWPHCSVFKGPGQFIQGTWPQCSAFKGQDSVFKVPGHSILYSRYPPYFNRPQRMQGTCHTSPGHDVFKGPATRITLPIPHPIKRSPTRAQHGDDKRMI